MELHVTGYLSVELKCQEVDNTIICIQNCKNMIQPKFKKEEDEKQKIKLSKL